MKKLSSFFLNAAICMIASHPLSSLEPVNNPEEIQFHNLNSSTDSVQTKIQQFLEKQKNNLSKEFPFFLNLFKDGEIAKNEAGIRISESTAQFPVIQKTDATQLSGLLFYYQLYDQAMRVPHWHANAVEIGIVTEGHMRITIWNGPGEANVFTVEKGNVWMIPQAAIHSLENIGEGNLEFLVAYNSADAEDRDFSTAWAALPEQILQSSLGLSEEDTQKIKHSTKNRLSLHDGEAIPTTKEISSPYMAMFSEMDPLYKSELGQIKRVDVNNWPVMQYMALQHTLMKPGSLREPHWYTTSDVFFFVKKGKAFFNLMDSEGKVYNTLIEQGGLVFIPTGTFHTFVNVGQEDLEVYEVFTSSGPLKEIGILDASQHFNPGTLSGALGISQESVKKLQHDFQHVYMRAL